MRFFTSDFHLGMESILSFERRPFENIDDMNKDLIDKCEKINKDDVIIHVGDLACYNSVKCKPREMLKNIKADFLNIRGNHDMNNRVKSLCESMTIKLGKKYPNVVVGHYPSYDIRAADYVKNGWICICGHVHGKWKHCLDLHRQILNINVGVDVWDYKLVSEDTLCQYIGSVLSHKPYDLYRCFMSKGKLVFQGKQEVK